MTIHIPKPLAIVLVTLLLGGFLALFLEELPDLIRYLKQEEAM